MEKHNLDDLIIDDEKNGNSKLNTIMTLILLALVILFIAILLTKYLMNDDRENPEHQGIEAYIDKKELIIQTPINASAKERTKPLEKTDTKEIITPSNKPIREHIDETNTTVKATEVKTVQKKDATSKKISTIHQPKQDDQIEAKTKRVKITDEFAQVPAKTTQVQPPKATIASTSDTKTQADKAPSSITSEHKTPGVKKETFQKVHKGQYYIQVGSFSGEIGKHFLAVLQKSGYRYKVIDVPNLHAKKLWVGPYASREEAEIALVRVKDRINKGAFIIAPKGR